MIKDLLRKNRKSFCEIISETCVQLRKCYSRIEIAYSKMGKKNRELFNLCVFHMKKGSKSRATIYANEISEIRRVLSFLEHTQLTVEQAILRLDTLKTVSPTFESLQETFMDVRSAAELITKVMPSVTPEIEMLNNAVKEIIQETEFNLPMSVAPVIDDQSIEDGSWTIETVAEELEITSTDSANPTVHTFMTTGCHAPGARVAAAAGSELIDLPQIHKFKITLLNEYYLDADNDRTVTWQWAGYAPKWMWDAGDGDGKGKCKRFVEMV